MRYTVYEHFLLFTLAILRVYKLCIGTIFFGLYNNIHVCMYVCMPYLSISVPVSTYQKKRKDDST